MDEITELDTAILSLDSEQNGDVTPPETDQPALTDDEYAVAHDERLSETLDLDTWVPGADLVEMQDRICKEISAALDQEKETEKHVREQIFPTLRERRRA